MATLELVEKLRQRANISYNEAKEALDASGDDILEAMIYLERKGKVAPPQGEGYYSSERPQGNVNENRGQNTKKNKKDNGERFASTLDRGFRRICDLIEKCNKNMLDIVRKDKTIISIPLTILIILTVFCFHLMVSLFVVGLIIGCRYRFTGWETANRVMDNASDSVENVKTEFKEVIDESHVRENTRQAAAQATESFKEAMNQSAAHMKEAAESVRDAFTQGASGVSHVAGSVREAFTQGASEVSHVAGSVKEAIYGSNKENETDKDHNEK